MKTKIRKDQVIMARIYSRAHDGEWEDPKPRKMYQKYDRKYLSVRIGDELRDLMKDSCLPCHTVTEITDDLYLVRIVIKVKSKRYGYFLEKGFVVLE